MKRLLLVVLLLWSRAASAQIPADSLATSARQGRADAQRLIELDSLVLLVPAHITERAQQEYAPILWRWYRVATRWYPIYLEPGEKPLYPAGYVEAFRDEVQKEVIRRYGRNAFKRAYEHARAVADSANAFERMPQWEAQEQTTGVRVLGWSAQYQAPRGIRKEEIPPYPLWVKVWVDDRVYIDEVRGGAESVEPLNGETYPRLRKKALTIAADLEFAPVPGMEVQDFEILVPITFVER